MIELHQFAPSYNLPNASPFCMKVETLLRMAGLDYHVSIVKDPSTLPKNKAPIIIDDGKTIADSTLIAEHLQTHYDVNFDENLTDDEKASAHMIQVMLEERTYWVLAYSRWIDPVNWKGVKEVYFGRIPMPMRMAVSKLAQKSMTRNLQGHGIGRHDPEDIYALGISDIQTLATVMKDKPFVMGNKPSLVDATVYAFLANLFVDGVNSPLKAAAEEVPAFKAYVARMTELYYPK
ncbi:MAG: glutathione S-transferase family protein [Magnetovibrio sp.]|nr:glutathione S-transferase family protein [Magnetovibrio sp.]